MSLFSLFWELHFSVNLGDALRLDGLREAFYYRCRMFFWSILKVFLMLVVTESLVYSVGETLQQSLKSFSFKTSIQLLDII